MVLKKVDHLSVDQMIALYDKRKKTQGVFLELVVYAENNVTNQCSNIFSDVFMSDDGLIVLNQALSCIRSDVLLNKAGILDD